MPESAETKEKKKIKYTDANGLVYREANGENVNIAKYDAESGLVEMLPDYTNFRAKVAQYLGENSMYFSDFARLGTDLNVKGNAAQGIPPKPRKNPRLGSKTRGVVEWYAKYHKQTFLDRFGVKELQRRVRIDIQKTEIRDEQGRKVPYEIKTAIYETVKGFDYDIDKLQGEFPEQRLIADAKTHLTFKMKDNASDSESDWDLDDGSEEVVGNEIE